MRWTIVSFMLVAITAGGHDKFKPIRLLPIDEAASAPDLKRTRDALLAAVKARDADAVMRFVSPDLVLENVGSENRDGRKILAEELKAPRALGEKDREYWYGLESSLSLGGAFTSTRGALAGRREFCAPYVYAAFPQSVPPEVQGETLPWALIRKDVELRAAPSANSGLLTRLSYALLQAPGAVRRDPYTDQMWQSVELSEGREAFVPADEIRDPAGYHACLASIDARWVLSSFTRHGSL